jgi:hypothetical protein
VTATTTTTIQGVSVLSRQKKRGTDVFELGLSHAGIEVRRPGRAVQQMSWERVSEWEIEERKGFVLLTLHGRGATTPLIVPGWSLDDLEILMRDVTSEAKGYDPEGPGPVVADAGGNGAVPKAEAPAAAAAAVAAAATAAPTEPKTAPKAAPKKTPAPPTTATVAPAPAAAPLAPTAPPKEPAPSPAAAPVPAPARQKAPTPSRAERRQQKSRQRRTLRSFAMSWRMVATVVLLGVLAAAVTLVLLQSAGVISWSFLGPVA